MGTGSTFSPPAADDQLLGAARDTYQPRVRRLAAQFARREEAVRVHVHALARLLRLVQVAHHHVCRARRSRPRAHDPAPPS